MKYCQQCSRTHYAFCRKKIKVDLTAQNPSASTQPDELEQEPTTLDPYLAALSDGAFRRMLSAAANQTATYVAMLFLPILSVVSGLMGKAVIRTHRKEITMEEVNVLWTCVAAPPGKLNIFKICYLIFGSDMALSQGFPCGEVLKYTNG